MSDAGVALVPLLPRAAFAVPSEPLGTGLPFLAGVEVALAPLAPVEDPVATGFWGGTFPGFGVVLAAFAFKSAMLRISGLRMGFPGGPSITFPEQVSSAASLGVAGLVLGIALGPTGERRISLDL